MCKQTALIIDFYLDHGRFPTIFHIYPILTDNTITNYQPRFASDSELKTIYDVLKEQSHWGTAESEGVKRGKDDTAPYIGFQLGAQNPFR